MDIENEILQKQVDELKEKNKSTLHVTPVVEDTTESSDSEIVEVRCIPGNVIYFIILFVHRLFVLDYCT